MAGYAEGGKVIPVDPPEGAVLVMVSRGEAFVSPDMVAKYGMEFLRKLYGKHTDVCVVEDDEEGDAT
jgi:hypothetical protein